MTEVASVTAVETSKAEEASSQEVVSEVATEAASEVAVAALVEEEADQTIDLKMTSPTSTPLMKKKPEKQLRPSKAPQVSTMELDTMLITTLTIQAMANNNLVTINKIKNPVLMILQMVLNITAIPSLTIKINER